MVKPGPNQTDRSVGARIRLRRKELGITQSDLAKELGVTFQQVQKYERGVNRLSATALITVARALKCTVASLLGVDGEGPAQPIEPTVLVTPGAVELLNAYNMIADHRSRVAVLAIARALVNRVGEVDEPEDEPELETPLRTQ